MVAGLPAAAARQGAQGRIHAQGCAPLLECVRRHGDVPLQGYAQCAGNGYSSQPGSYAVHAIGNNQNAGLKVFAASLDRHGPGMDFYLGDGVAFPQ